MRRDIGFRRKVPQLKKAMCHKLKAPHQIHRDLESAKKELSRLSKKFKGSCFEIFTCAKCRHLHVGKSRLMTQEDFFRELFKSVKDDDFKILFTSKGGEKGLEGAGRVSPNDADGLSSVIESANDSKRNLFFHCGVDLEEKSKDRKVRLKNSDVSGVAFLWTDTDIPLTAKILAQLKDHEYAPSVIINSGNGFHCYWILSEFYTNTESATKKNKFLASRFKGDATSDMARLLRVPGSHNCKNGDFKEVTVAFVQLDNYDRVKRWRVEDIPEATGVVLGFKEAKGEHVTLPDDFLDDPRWGNCAWVKGVMMEPLEKGDRSDRDWKVAAKMAELGFSESEIFSTLTHNHWPIGDKGRENMKYARNQASRASEKAQSSVALIDAIAAGFAKKKEQDKVDPDKLRKTIMDIHADILQVGGSYRKCGADPKLGGLFGEQVAEAVSKAGYRFVFDPEYRQSFISDMKGNVWEADKDSSVFKEFVSDISGYSSGQQEFGYIAEGVQTYIRNRGERVTVGRFVFLDQESGKYYILVDGEKGTVMSVDREGNTEMVPNGVGNVFLRPRVMATQPINIIEEYVGRKGVAVLEREFTRYIAGTKEAKRFLTAFMVSSLLCYGSDIRTLPILHLTGDTGSGKSATLGLITSFLFGHFQLCLYTTAAAFRTAPSEIFMAHDDREDVKEDLEQYFLVGATSAFRIMSNMGKQTDVVTQKVHVINGVTSIGSLKTTALRRRALVLEIDKGKFNAETLTSDSMSVILDMRDRMWSGIMPVFSAMISKFESGEFRRVSDEVYANLKIDAFKGLSDFLALMVLVDQEISKIMGRATSESLTIKEFCDVCGVQDAEEILGRDPVILCLESFFEQIFSVNAKEIYNTSNLGTDTQTIAISRGVKRFQWELTTEEENKEVEELLGYEVRGIKASSTGWVSIFSADTREFAKSINSPASLGKQFGRVAENKDFPFFIRKGRVKSIGRVWNAFQRVE